MNGGMSMEPEIAERLLAAGDAFAALSLAEAALASGGSTQPEWWQVMALALAATGRPKEAHLYFSRYAQARPLDSDAWVNLGSACLDCADPPAALQAFGQARATGAAGAAYLLGYGLALLASERFQDAYRCLGKARALEPEAADICLAWGQCLAELERYEELGECVARIDPGELSHAQRGVLAWLLAQAGRDADAVRLYRLLLDEDPGALECRAQLLLLLERLNRLPEAAAVLASAPTPVLPHSSIAALAMARLARRQGQAAAAAGFLQPAIAKERNDAMAAQLQFELAKCQEQTGQVDAVMAALALAHQAAGRALRQRSPDLAAGEVLGWMDQRLQRAAPARWKDPQRSADPPDPVFLVGFPRSGTTLLEQVLGCHSGLDVLDERPALETVIAHLRGLPGWSDQALDASLDGLDAGKLQQARDLYRAQVARYLQPVGRVVDKYPLYLTRVPYIQRLFPGSDWLLLLRHPCDCVLSCYMQAFGLNGGALAFSSLESTARTYVAVMSWWEEQRILAGPRVQVLRYEDLVGDFPGTLGAVMAFLSLQPEAVQADFSRVARDRPARINTPSYAQVAQPLNSAAKDRWQRYRSHFSPAVLALLAPWVQRYGYTLD